MSKHNVANKDRYEIAGRLKPGDPALQEQEKREYTLDQARRRGRRKRGDR